MANKTIVVTGGAGFIGSHLCEALQKAGHRVISLDNYFVGSKDNHVAGVEYRAGHTKDIATLIPESPDLVYHLGEYSRVEISLTEPDKVWDLNTQGTCGVLEFWRNRKCKLVYAGSSTKFGDGGLGRLQSPYAWSKASNTELVGNYGRWYNLPYAITYFYNVYGPRERPAHEYGTLIETFRRQMKSGNVLTVVSPGTQKRNFTHVKDIVEGLLAIGERGEGDEYGLGAEESFSVLEVAKLFGGSIEMLPERAGNRMDSTLDTAKSRALGWSARHKLGDYIRAI
ncbi:MAG: NAD-dependent epimerase/dehydratase family protein [Candidatus Pacebacteria bacterium]|nr:NAD-dependent epimerase/dehydratase family protein [Candidatus Paceibacterota bacterium]